MQFRKILEKLIDDMLPDWRHHFLCYKDLKKQLKRIYFRVDGDDGCNKRMKSIAGEKHSPDPKEIAAFVNLCHEQIVKFNNFVLDQQEWYIIRIEVLEGNLVATKSSNQDQLMKDLADLHGEIILLLHYSSFNYTGLAKILKKYDKLSGALVRVPFIQKVLNEPFYEADVLNSLVRKCEAMLGEHFPVDKQQGLSRREEDQLSVAEEEKGFVRDPELEHVEIKNMENRYLKLTLSALESLREIRNGSSTVGMFSLPPMIEHGDG